MEDSSVALLFSRLTDALKKAVQEVRSGPTSLVLHFWNKERRMATGAASGLPQSAEPLMFIAPHRMPAEMKGVLLSRIMIEGQGFIASGRVPANILDLVCAYLSTPDVKSVASACARMFAATNAVLENRLKIASDDPIHLTTEQRFFYEKVVDKRKSICIMGEAGTGKSALLRAIHGTFHSRGMNMFVTAPTALAAQKAGGITIHDFMGLGIYQKSESDLDIYASVGMPDGDMQHEGARRARMSEVLAIDEISMVSWELWDYLDLVMRCFRKRKDVPFGGLQIVCFGDFAQLPPVPDPKKQFFRPNSARFCFESPTWQRVFGDPYAVKNPYMLVLTKQMRQSHDKVLLRLLRTFRSGNPTQYDRDILESRMPAAIERRKEWFGQAMVVAAKNDEVKVQNEMGLKRLGKIPKTTFYQIAKLLVPVADISAEEYIRTFLSQRNENLTPLTVKVGARVILTINMREHRLCNRMTGTVQELLDLSDAAQSIELYNRLNEPEKSTMLAKHPTRTFRIAGDNSCWISYDDMRRNPWSIERSNTDAAIDDQLFIRGFPTALPVVEFDCQPNAYYLVLPCTRSFAQSTLESQEDMRKAGRQKPRVVYRDVIAVTKFPLNLGYAQTVHGVQGQTLERVRINLSGCWMRQQVYVSLSRVRELRHLCIESLPDWHRLYGTNGEEDDDSPTARLNAAIDLKKRKQQHPAKKQPRNKKAKKEAKKEEDLTAYGLENL